MDLKSGGERWEKKLFFGSHFRGAPARIASTARGTGCHSCCEISVLYQALNFYRMIGGIGAWALRLAMVTLYHGQDSMASIQWHHSDRALFIKQKWLGQKCAVMWCPCILCILSGWPVYYV